jgi:hypothetical protein
LTGQGGLNRVALMGGLENPGKFVMGAGAILLLVGGLMVLAGKSGWIGRLPGDIRVEREGFTLYFPLATSILLSVILTLILNFLFRRR